MHDKVATTKDIESIAFGKKYIWLPTDQLSDSEKLLIQLGNGSLQPDIDNRNHPWYPILFEHQPVQEPEWIRLLQVHFTRTIDSLQSEWLAESSKCSLAWWIFFPHRRPCSDRRKTRWCQFAHRRSRRLIRRFGYGFRLLFSAVRRSLPSSAPRFHYLMGK